MHHCHQSQQLGIFFLAEYGETRLPVHDRVPNVLPCAELRQQLAVTHGQVDDVRQDVFAIETHRFPRARYPKAADARLTTSEISSRVVHRPRLKRIAPSPMCSGTAMAFKTGESSTRPEWQAEPVEAAIPLNAESTSEP
jgi:hypothetical protein